MVLQVLIQVGATEAAKLAAVIVDWLTERLSGSAEPEAQVVFLTQQADQAVIE